MNRVDSAEIKLISRTSDGWQLAVDKSRLTYT